MVKVRDIKKLQEDTENDPIIRDEMANLGCPLVCTFHNFLESVLVVAYLVNKLDLRLEQSFENKGY